MKKEPFHSEHLFWAFIIAFGFAFHFSMKATIASLAPGVFLFLSLTHRSVSWISYSLGVLIPLLISVTGFLPYTKPPALWHLLSVPVIVPAIVLGQRLRSTVRYIGIGGLFLLAYIPVKLHPIPTGRFLPWLLLVTVIATVGFTWPYLRQRETWWNGLFGLCVYWFTQVMLYNAHAWFSHDSGSLSGALMHGFWFPLVVDMLLLNTVCLILFRAQQPLILDDTGGSSWKNVFGFSSIRNIRSNSGVSRKKG